MEKSTTRNQRILLVDDDVDLLRLLSIRLSGAGYEIMTSTSAEEALAQLPVFNPHLVVTDLRMGGMDGLALFDHIPGPFRPHPQKEYLAAGYNPYRSWLHSGSGGCHQTRRPLFSDQTH